MMKNAWLKKTELIWVNGIQMAMRCFLVWPWMTLWGRFPHSYGCLPKGRSQRSELPPPKKNSHSRTKRCIPFVSNSTVKHKEFHHHNQTKRLVIAGPLSSAGQSTTLLRKESTKHTSRSNSLLDQPLHHLSEAIEPIISQNSCLSAHLVIARMKATNLEPQRQPGRPLGDIYQNICTTIALEIREEVVSLLSSTKRLVGTFKCSNWKWYKQNLWQNINISYGYRWHNFQQNPTGTLLYIAIHSFTKHHKPTNGRCAFSTFH